MKKTLQHPKADEDERRIFQETIKAYQAQNRVIVYIDESGFAHDMPRTHGYAPIGKRCHGVCDWHARGRVNVIGALIDKCLLTVGLFESNIDADTFFGWTIHDLLPKLPPASVVVMDNATFHKRLDIQNAITQAGHTLEYLPVYSPDLNPIEHKWAQTKAIRKQQNKTVEQLFKIKSFYVT
ncbi:IS630 family transposase [Nitrosomonas europaea]|uniref:IS630 family transposase n=1 Tax=Nitrosomonas europaea TaxID=915 RepID=UPI003264C382